MGLGSLALPGSLGVPGGMNTSILAAIALPDAESQRKYEAMGLPDPVAFAALAALGAIPNPMAMLNKMMLAAQERIERGAAPGTVLPPPRPLTAADLALAAPVPQLHRHQAVPPPLAIPPGKSFIEAFHDMQRAQQEAGSEEARLRREAAEAERREAMRVREAAEQQARMAADRAKEAVLTATTNRDAIQLDLQSVHAVYSREAGMPKDLANVFSAAGDDDGPEEEPRPGRPGRTTLSSLLRGPNAPQDNFGALSMAAAGVGGPEKICISRLPVGINESAVRLECARHGAVTSVVMHGDVAYVSFAQADMATVAAKRLADRRELFGSPPTDPPQVDVVYEVPDAVRLAASLPLSGSSVQEPVDPALLPEYLRPRKERKRKKRRSRSRRRGRSRSAVRWLDRSRSNSHTATGQYIRAVGCSSTVRWWDKKKENRSSSSGSSSGSARRRRAEEENRRPRQVGLRGTWAQLAHQGVSYYYHIPSGRTRLERPSDFEEGDSRQDARRPTSCFL